MPRNSKVALLEYWNCRDVDRIDLVVTNYFETNNAPDGMVARIKLVEERMTSKQRVGIVEVKAGKRPITAALYTVHRSFDNVHKEGRTMTKYGGKSEFR